MKQHRIDIGKKFCQRTPLDQHNKLHMLLDIRQGSHNYGILGIPGMVREFQIHQGNHGIVREY